MFQSVSEIVKQGDLSSKLEPALGFEPRTDGLQNRSSTAELSRHVISRSGAVRVRTLSSDGSGTGFRRGNTAPGREAHARPDSGPY